MKSIIYYFSGTGNSYYIAKRLSESLSCEIEQISEMPYTVNQFDRIGIVCPVYATHAPSVVIRYISDLKLSSPAHIFSVISYSGSYGYAARDIFEQVKGYNPLVYQNFKIRMPGSSLLEYSAFPDCMQKVLLNSAEKKIEKILASITKQIETPIIKPNLLARLFSKNGYAMMDNYSEKGTKFYTNSHCMKCRKCVNLCPVRNIVWEENHPVWGNHCQQCMACIQWCPYNALGHPEIENKNRKRYHNPHVTLEMLTEAQMAKVPEDYETPL